MRSHDLTTRSAVDLYAIFLATPLLLLTLAAFPNAIALRVALGIPFILLFPGYALVAALFPATAAPTSPTGATAARAGGLGGLERAALSLGMSIAIVPLLGLALNFSPWGIRLAPVAITLSVFTLGASAIALARRKRVPPQARPRFGFEVDLPKWREMGGIDRALAAGVVVALLVASGSVAYVIVTPRVGETFTEFYILGPDGKAENYPTTLGAGESGELLVGIVNHENRATNYTVDMSLVAINFTTNATGARTPVEGERTTLPGFTVELDDDATHEAPYTFTVTTSEPAKLVLALCRADSEEPYRTLHLWLNMPSREAPT